MRWIGEELPPASIPAAIFRPFVFAEDGREEPLDPWRGPVDPGAQWIANVEVALAGVQESPGAGDLVARRGGRDAPRTLQRGHRVGDGALVRGCRGRAAGLGDGLEAREEERLQASAVDVDASDDDDDDEDADARRLDGARCEVYRAGLDTDADRRASRRHDGRGGCTAARDDTKARHGAVEPNRAEWMCG